MSGSRNCIGGLFHKLGPEATKRGHRNHCVHDEVHISGSQLIAESALQLMM